MQRSPSIEEELALRLCRTAACRTAERSTIEALGRSADSDRLMAVLERQRILALAGSRLDSAIPGEMSSRFSEAVENRIATNRRRGALFDHLTQNLCDALESAGIATAALKGAGLAERAHRDLGLRASQSDIDLLVAPKNLQRAVKILVATGCTVDDNVDWGGGLPHYHTRLINQEPVRCTVEIHWRLHWYERLFAVEALARAERASDGSRRLLRPCDELAMLLLTFARDGYLGLRLASDVAAWWDACEADFAKPPLDAIIAEHPPLRNPLLAAVDVLEAEVGLPARQLVSPALVRPRRLSLAKRLASWTGKGEPGERATNITLNDLLLTPWGAFRVFLRHYYLQPLDHYKRVYAWPEDQRLRNRARRLLHVAGRLGRSSVRYGCRLWQLRGDRVWDPLPANLDRPEWGGDSLAETRVLIVSPVRNEAAHIERVVRSVAAQTRPPNLWLVADNGSDDGTLEILRGIEGEVPFLRVVVIPPPPLNGRDRLAQALEAKAFNRALAEVDAEAFTHIGKLDGDIELPPDYFERVLGRMAGDARLGICGGSIAEPTGIEGKWQRVGAPVEHVHGALKLFSRECFQAVGGIRERLGWDTIDETYARMHGFETRRDLELVAKHHRPGGSADGKLRGRMRHGQCAYIARYSSAWVLARSFKIAIRWDPRGVSGLAFFWGYLSGALRRVDRVEDDEFKRFVRAEQRRRIRQGLRLRRGEAQCMTSA